MTFVRKLLVTSSLALLSTFAISGFAKEVQAGEVEAASNRICACIESGNDANCKPVSSTSTESSGTSKDTHK